MNNTYIFKKWSNPNWNFWNNWKIFKAFFNNLTSNSEWEELSSYTNKKLQPSLFLNWRKEQINELLWFLKNNWKKIEIKSNSLLESYMFFFAVFTENEQKWYKVLISSNQESFNELLKSEEKLIIVPKKWFIPEKIWWALEKWHNIVLFSSKTKTTSINFDKTIELGVMNRFDRIDWLKDILWDKDLAEKVYWETKWYIFPIIRHKLLDFNENMKPEWLEKTEVNIITTIFLINEWKEWERKDEDLIEHLSWIKYSVFQRKIEILAKQDDTPIRKISNVWQLVSKNDLWTFVEWIITKSTLGKFYETCIYALSDLDPRLEIPIEDRYMANILTDKRPEFSSKLKRWLSDSICLLSTSQDEKIKKIIDSIVLEVLESDEDISRLLNSIWWNIENLAESSPKIFLNFIEKNIDKLDWVFEQWWDMFFWWSWSYVNLLWALERISWNEEYISDVVSIFFELDKKYNDNIRKNQVNRAMSTLLEIFILWMNNTILSIEDRIKILKRESLHHESRVFILLIKLLNQRTSTWVAKENYQNWSSWVKLITRKEYNDYLLWIIDLVIELFEKDIENRIVEIVENFTKFSKEQFERIIEILLNYDFSQFRDKNILLKVQEEISRKIYYNKIYNDAPAHQSLLNIHPEFIEKLIQLYKNIIKNNKDLYMKSLFENEWQIILSKLDEYKWEKWHWAEERKISNSERVDIIEKIYKKEWFEWILKIAILLDRSYLLIQSITESNFLDKVKKDIFNLLDNKNRNLQFFAINFVNNLDFKKDDFIQNKKKEINLFKNNNFIANFLLWLKLDSETLNLVKKQWEEIQKMFWEWLSKLWYYISLREEDYWELNYFIKELNKYWLINIAFEQINSVEYDKKLDLINNEIIIETLHKLVIFINEKKWTVQSLDYHLKWIFDYLYKEQEKWKVTSDEMIGLEQAFIRIIENPKNINKAIANNPELYVWFLSNIYLWKWEKKNPTKENKIKAENSYEILKKFKLIPWTNESWNINYKVLEEWIEKSLKLLKEKKRFWIGSDKIGELLSYCWIWKDWVWPCEEIRKILKKFKNIEMENGFSVWKFNQRWCVTKWVFDWGCQERDIAKSYLEDAKKIKIDYPRTSRILKEMWEWYLRDAKREDDRVELR